MKTGKKFGHFWAFNGFGLALGQKPNPCKCLIYKCPEPESNRHDLFRSQDFKSVFTSAKSITYSSGGCAVANWQYLNRQPFRRNENN